MAVKGSPQNHLLQRRPRLGVKETPPNPRYDAGGLWKTTSLGPLQTFFQWSYNNPYKMNENQWDSLGFKKTLLIGVIPLYPPFTTADFGPS